MACMDPEEDVLTNQNIELVNLNFENGDEWFRHLTARFLSEAWSTFFLFLFLGTKLWTSSNFWNPQRQLVVVLRLSWRLVLWHFLLRSMLLLPGLGRLGCNLLRNLLVLSWNLCRNFHRYFFGTRVVTSGLGVAGGILSI